MAIGTWRSIGTSGGPPNGSVDVASFDLSSITALSLSAQTQVGSIAFSPGASAYTISSSSGFALTVTGHGIANNSGVTQTFLVAGSDGLIRFTNNAAAGFNIGFATKRGEDASGMFGVTEFRDRSTAGNG